MGCKVTFENDTLSRLAGIMGPEAAVEVMADLVAASPDKAKLSLEEIFNENPAVFKNFGAMMEGKGQEGIKTEGPSPTPKKSSPAEKNLTLEAIFNENPDVFKNFGKDIFGDISADDINTEPLSQIKQREINEVEKAIDSNRVKSRSARGADRKALKSKLQQDKDTLKKLKEELQNIKELESISDLEEVSRSIIQNMEERLNTGSLSPNEMLSMLQSSRAWKEVLNYHDSAILSDELKAKHRDTLQDRFAMIKAHAERVESDLFDMAKENIREEINKTSESDYSMENLFGGARDISWVGSQAFRAGHDDPSTLGQIIPVMMKETNFEAFKEMQGRIKKVDELFPKANKAAKDLGYKDVGDMFSERDDKGRLTGGIIVQTAPGFFDERAALSREVAQLEEKVKKNPDLDSYKRKLAKAQKERSEWFRKNTILLDPSRIDDQAYIDSLKTQYGDVFIEGMARSQRELLQNFEIDADLKRDDLIAKHGETEGEAKYQEWLKFNSPQSTFSSQSDPSIKAHGWQYLMVIPDPAKWTNPQFNEINSNPDLKEFFDLATQITEQMMSYMPAESQSYHSSNMLPVFRKGLLESISGKGLWKGLASGSRKSVEMILDAVGDIDFDGETESGEDPVRSKLSFSEGSKERLFADAQVAKYMEENDIADIKDVPPDVVSEAKKDARHKFAQEKSSDLGKVLKLYTMLATNYKHRANNIGTFELMKAVYDEIPNLSRRRRHRPGIPMMKRENAIKALEWQFDSFKQKKKPNDGKLVSLGKKTTKRDKEFINSVEAVMFNPALEKKEVKTLRLREEKLENAISNASDTDRPALVQELQEVKAELYNPKVDQELVSKIKEEYDKQGKIVTVASALDSAMKWFHLNSLGWKATSAAMNFTFGQMGNAMYAQRDQEFSSKNLEEAMSDALNFLAPSQKLRGARGNAVKNAIESVLDEFDLLTDQRNEVYANPTAAQKRIGVFGRLLTPYGLTSQAEVMNQVPVMVAMMKAEEIGDSNLYEYYIEHKSWPEGFDSNRFRTKVMDVIATIHGNYDPDFPPMITKHVAGRMLVMFRRWALRAAYNRWGKESDVENVLLGRKTKGRYRSVADYYKAKRLNGTTALLTSFQLAGLTGRMMAANMFYVTRMKKAREWVSPKGAMDEMIEARIFSADDAANMKANLQEASFLMMVLGITWLLKAGLDDDEEKKPMAIFTFNQLRKVQNDLFFYVNPNTLVEVIREPTPMVRFLQDFSSLIPNFFNWLFYEDEIKHGKYKGQSKFGRNIRDILPFTSMLQKLESETKINRSELNK